MNIPHGVYLFIHFWLFKLFLLLANISNEHVYTRGFFGGCIFSFLSCIYLGRMIPLCLTILGAARLFFHGSFNLRK